MLPKVTWQFLSQFHKIPPRILIPRTPEIQKSYEFYKTTTHVDLKWSLFPEESNSLYQFLPNKYPYNIEDNIKHYVLWFNPKLPSCLQESNLFVDFILQHKIINQNNVLMTSEGLHPYIFWKNSSVKNMTHYQVFYRTNNSF
jgi:hypothetical protein